MLAMGLLALLAASAHGAVYSLDEAGMGVVMAGRRATVIAFTPSNDPAVHALWSQLEKEFAPSGVTLATVDCSMHVATCAARKIAVNEMIGPIIKYWSPEGAFRRYAGQPELGPLRAYVTKKLLEMTEAQQGDHRRKAMEEARAASEAQQQQQQQQRAQQQSRRRGDMPQMSDKTRATLEWVLYQCFPLVILLCVALYMYLRRPFVEAKAHLALVGSATSPSPYMALVRVDEPSGVLTPVARMPLARGCVPAPLCVSRGGKQSFVLHAASPGGAHAEGRAQGHPSGKAAPPASAALIVRSNIIDPSRGPCSLEVAARGIVAGGEAGAGGEGRALALLRRGRLVGGKRNDTIAIGSPDGSLFAMSVPTPTVMPPFDPSTLERVVRYLARAFLLPKPLPCPYEPVVIRPPRAAAGASSSSAADAPAAPLSVSCVALSIPNAAPAAGVKKGKKGSKSPPAEEAAQQQQEPPKPGGTTHVLVSDAELDRAWVYELSGDAAKCAFELVGEWSTAKGRRPCALAAHPVDDGSSAIAYILCEGDRSVVAIEVTRSGPPSTLHEVTKLEDASKGGGKAKQKPAPRSAAGGALCVSADGRHVYAMLGGSRTVHALTAHGEGKRLSLAGSVEIPTDGDGILGVAPSLALSGDSEGSLLVADGRRLLAYRRDASSGALEKAPLSSLPMEAPCAIATLQWP